ncbi:MAG: tetratricopeptide repeat protein [Terracidiphilus sp.]
MEAQAKLGFKYLFGEGVPKDPALAFKWSYKAAVAGSPLAAKDICAAYFMGVGVSQNKQAGFEWCWIAASRGEPIAQRNLASRYRDGVGVGKDLTLAYAWAIILRNAGDKDNRIPPILDALEKDINPDQRSEAIALASEWGKNKEHVMPVHSRWYLENAPRNEDAQVQPRAPPRAGVECSTGHWISDKMDDGKYIKLENGSVWEVQGADTVDSTLWLEMDEITVCTGKLINTDEHESVEAKRIK